MSYCQDQCPLYILISDGSLTLQFQEFLFICDCERRHQRQYHEYIVNSVLAQPRVVLRARRRRNYFLKLQNDACPPCMFVSPCPCQVALQTRCFESGWIAKRVLGGQRIYTTSCRICLVQVFNVLSIQCAGHSQGAQGSI